MLNRVGDSLLELHRGCRKQTVEAFPGWAMALVQRAIPHSIWSWGSSCGMDGGFVVHSFLCNGMPSAEEILQTWGRYQHLDVFAARGYEQPNVVHNFTHEMMKEHEVYHLFHHQMGIEQMLGIHADKPSCGLQDGISLSRSDPATPFSEDERLAMQCLIPHLIETRHINYLEHLSANTQFISQRAIMAAADDKGVIHVAGDDFAALMQSEWPRWQGPRLPGPLVRNFGATAQRYVGNTITVRSVPVSGMYLLKARPRTPVDDLGKRELEVACYFAGGLTHKEIAREMCLTPATVRNNVSAIYLKLDIDNKAKLATLLAARDAD